MFKVAMLSSAIVLFAFNANADTNNVIRFTGQVNSQTCDMTIDDSTNSTPIVLLPPAKSSELDVANKVSTTSAKFKLGLTNCTAPPADTDIGVSFVSHDHTVAGDLLNTATTGAARNVVIRLYDGMDNKINLSNGQSNAAGLTLKAGETTASTEFIAKYATNGGAASAGNVEATVQFALTYQ